ncbi:FtsK/SpoIIIE domain-containing protein [Streptomyces sp. DE06-01C]|uniref:FtsK/SpoIIIE domain-containing protein n=1 Tax=Streptomyces sp. DE06-01C TaxID=3028656 RepID=UPI0029C9EF0D|nr:FtsK/SpoIIIE domain-containing protein [Streptomyces sp. DE06-01C]
MKEASQKPRKTKAPALRAGVTNTLDALSPMCAPFAARWDAEADRRHTLRTPENLKKLMAAQREHTSARSTAAAAKSQRTAARAASKNPLSAARRSAATADKASRSHLKVARAALENAKAEYPSTLRASAVRAHSLHVLPAGIASWALSTPVDWSLWPVSVSAGLVALNAGLLLVGRRTVQVEIEDGVSAEERALMGRLDPSYWVQNADARGLGGTVTTPPRIGLGGIACEVRLDGQWTVKTLAAKADSIRALLGARASLRMRITGASRGGWAVISLNTRKATDGTSAMWRPDLMPADPLMMSLGQDTETGDAVLVPFDERMLIAGASGTGKSWSTRPLLATAHLRGDLVLIDGKGEEGTIWESVCRVAVEADEIENVIDEIHDEMNRRKRDMKSRGISVWDGPQLTVLVDEGQVVLAMVKGDADRLQRLIELSSLGRSRGIVLWWATQKPVMSGGAPGVHNLIAPNLLTRFSLRVADAQEAQTALDDCADYQPQKIERGKEWRGHGYLKDFGPRIIRTWTLDDAGVKALPVKVWSGSGTSTAGVPAAQPEAKQPALRLVKDAAAATTSAVAVEAATDAGPITNRHRVLDAVAYGARTNRDIVDRTELNKGTVSKLVKSLTESGELVKDPSAGLILGGGREVSA